MPHDVFLKPAPDAKSSASSGEFGMRSSMEDQSPSQPSDGQCRSENDSNRPLDSVYQLKLDELRIKTETPPMADLPKLRHDAARERGHFESHADLPSQKKCRSSGEPAPISREQVPFRYLSKKQAFDYITEQRGSDYGTMDCLGPLHTQPETIPTTREQPAVEFKGIYAGLVMVEAKCVNIDNQKVADLQENLSPEQWQAFVALHRTLLYEHHDVLMTAQHPAATPALRGLATKYCMPARMWKHSIHAFLEVLRHRRPQSQENTLSFIYLAYEMMAVLLETVPAFVDTWSECLGALARYRMAIEEDKEIQAAWGDVACSWYKVAFLGHATVGRWYRHLKVLQRSSLSKIQVHARSLLVAMPYFDTQASGAKLREQAPDDAWQTPPDLRNWGLQVGPGICLARRLLGRDIALLCSGLLLHSQFSGALAYEMDLPEIGVGDSAFRSDPTPRIKAPEDYTTFLTIALIVMSVLWVLWVTQRPCRKSAMPPSVHMLAAFAIACASYIMRGAGENQDVQRLAAAMWCLLTLPGIAKLARLLQHPIAYLVLLTTPPVALALHLAASGWTNSDISEKVLIWGPIGVPAWAGFVHLCQRGHQEWSTAEVTTVSTDSVTISGPAMWALFAETLTTSCETLYSAVVRRIQYLRGASPRTLDEEHGNNNNELAGSLSQTALHSGGAHTQHRRSASAIDQLRGNPSMFTLSTDSLEAEPAAHGTNAAL